MTLCHRSVVAAAAVAAFTLGGSGAFSPPFPALRLNRRHHSSALSPPLAAAENNDDSGDAAPAAGPKKASAAAAADDDDAGPRSSSSSTPRARRSGGRRSGPRTERRPVATRSRQRPERGYSVATKRAPHQFDHTKDIARPFVDTVTEIQGQVANEDAEPYDLEGGGELTKMNPPREMRAAGSGEEEDPAAAATEPKKEGDLIEQEHVQFRSLDDVFGPDLGVSDLFSSSTTFRDELRSAMREDVFDTTPAYASMSPKARRMLLLPDSSLQGSWKCEGGRWLGHDADHNDEGGEEKGGDEPKVRMTKLTKVLRSHLGPSAPTGDAFMDAIGSLCGSSPTTHWIDIIGVTERRIAHSWHQDTGRSHGGDTYTVMLGFPPEDEYDGVGVFSHAVKLRREAWAEEGVDPPNEPVVYTGTVDDKYVVRPRFAKGREIVVYRDVDVIHSAPDVAYRASVMRFM